MGLAGNGIVIFSKVVPPLLFWCTGSKETPLQRGIASARSVARTARSGKGAEPDGRSYASERATSVPVLHE